MSDSTRPDGSAPALKPVNVGVLGATGTVGQRFIALLASHPYFRLHALGASERSAGKPYGQVVRWRQTVRLPDAVANLVVQPCTPKAFADCPIVFSGLDADVAGEIESAFRAAELAVFSNAKNFRMDPLVPLLVPLADMSHFEILAAQRKSVGLDRGFIMTNANCAVTGLAVALYALEQRFGPVSEVCVTTLQAVSGAGYPGVPSLDIYDNVVPYIGGEEDKLETELQKILGGVCASGASALPHRSDMKVSATCTRVAVLDGHTEAVSVKFANATPSPEEAAECLRAFVSDAQKLGCPSAPPRCAIVRARRHRSPAAPARPRRARRRVRARRAIAAVLDLWPQVRLAVVQHQHRRGDELGHQRRVRVRKRLPRLN